MNKTICRALVLGATLTMTSACWSSTPQTSSSASVVPQLFTLQPTQNRQSLQKTAEGYLKTLLADPANEEFTLVTVDASMIGKNTQDVTIAFPNGKTEKFHLRDFNVYADGYEGWVGYQSSKWKESHSASKAEIDFDPQYYMSVVRHGNQLTGDFLVAGQRYQLAYIGADTHALIKVNESKLPPEDAPDAEAQPAESLPVTGSQEPMAAHSVIRLLFVSTVQSRAKNPNYRSALTVGLQNVNQIAKNSQVEITYELAGFVDSAIDEAGKSFATLLNEVEYRNPEVKAKRVELKADLVSMYVTNSEVCGAGKLATSKEKGFSAISCISSLAHEIGHNFGMNHNWDGKSATYINGYRYQPSERDRRFRTQMSSECSPACPRVPFYSTPRVSYQGQPLGTVANHDVARAMNEHRERIENFYPPLIEERSWLVNRKRFDEGGLACATINQYRDVIVSACPSKLDKNEANFSWAAIKKTNSYSIRFEDSQSQCFGQPLFGGGYRLTKCQPSGVPGKDISWLLKSHTGGMSIEDYNDSGQCLALRNSDNHIVKQPCDDRDPAQQWLWSAGSEALK